METPIALVIFNRPEQTKRVVDALRMVKPTLLYVTADGPRTPEEKILCEKTREVIEGIDWPCTVKKQYSDTNLGCGVNESRAFSWIFSEVDRAILLEDDCLPHQTFFKYCEELLEKYKDDARIMSISGNFFQQENKNFTSPYSYYFSSLPHVWGWATWKRAWEKYDYSMSSWPELRKSKKLASWFKYPAMYEYWSNVWDQYYRDNENNWDARWVFACAVNEGISINPCVNLVTNIGFGEDATHSKTFDNTAEIESHPMLFPLLHPPTTGIDYAADEFTLRNNFGVDDKLFYRLVRPIKTHFPRAYQKAKDILLPFLRR